MNRVLSLIGLIPGVRSRSRNPFGAMPSAFLVLGFLVLGAASTARAQCVWTGPSDHWTVATAWNSCVGTFPNSSSISAILNANGDTLTLDSTDIPVTVSSMNMELGTLNLGTGGSLTVAGTTTVGLIATLQLSGGTLIEDGNLTNNGEIIGFGTISGTGTVTSNSYLAAVGGTLDLSGIDVVNLLAGGILTGKVGDQFVAGQTSTAGTLKLPGDIVAIGGVSVTLTGTGSEITDASNGNALTGLNTVEVGGDLSVLNGATLTTTAALTNSGSSVVQAQGSGALTIGGNLTNQTGGDVFAAGGKIIVNGTLSNDATSYVYADNGGSLTMTGALTNAGTVNVGPSPGGVLTTMGNYTQTGGTTEVYSGGMLTVLGIGGYSNNGGTTTVDSGGTLSVTNAYTNGVAATVVNGTLDSDSFSTVSGGTTTVGIGGFLSVTNTFSNSGIANILGALAAGSFSNSGSVNVSSSNLINPPLVAVTSGGFTNNSGGTLTINSIGANMTVIGGFTNNGTVSMTGTGDNLKTDSFSNTNNVSIGAGETLTTSGNYTQTAGNTTIGGKLTVNTLDASGGTLTLMGAGDVDPIAVSISGTAALQGTGTVAANLTMTGGSIQPGVTGTPGTLTITGNYTQSGTGVLDELISTTGFGILNVSGNVNLDPADSLDVQLLGGYDPANGTTFDFLTYGTLTPGSTFNIIDPNFGGDQMWVISSYGTGADSYLQLEAEAAPAGGGGGGTPTPEPGTLVLLGAGLLCLGGCVRRRKGAAATR
jgi:fibronectin-binding autotransporter adhesin